LALDGQPASGVERDGILGAVPGALADVYRFALFLSGDHDLAEDIVSETFIRVWHARDRLDLTTGQGLPPRDRPEPLPGRAPPTARRTALVDEHVDPRPGPEQRRPSSRGELQAVLSALQALPRSSRAAVLAAGEESLSYEEIGGATRLNPSPRGSRSTRANETDSGARRRRGAREIPKEP